MKNRYCFKLALALTLHSSLSVLNSWCNITPTIYPLGNQPNGLTVSGNNLYVTTDVASDYFFSVFESDGEGDLTLAGPANPSTGSGGYNPLGAMFVSGSTLYGTGSQGSSDADGCVFAVNTDGSDFIVLHTFEGSDGSGPPGGLILSGNVLYGTTSGGGSGNVGTVFAMDTAGNFTNLYSFTGSGGANPPGGLVLSGNTLYGTTSTGGSNNDGTMFAINTGGTGYTVLHTFTGSGGANPSGGLVLSGNTLYGITSTGGSNNDGTVFTINTGGGGYTVLHAFNGSDGYHPQSPLVLAGDTLYGVTSNSTSGGCIFFAVNTDGKGFTVMDSGFATDLAGGLVAIRDTTNTTLVGMGAYDYSIPEIFTFTVTPPATLPPVVLSAPQITGGKTDFTFQLSGPAGSNYVLQASTNLLNWSSVSTSTIPISGSINLSNAISGYHRKFYRAFLP